MCSGTGESVANRAAARAPAACASACSRFWHASVCLLLAFFADSSRTKLSRAASEAMRSSSLLQCPELSMKAWGGAFSKHRQSFTEHHVESEHTQTDDTLHEHANRGEGSPQRTYPAALRLYMCPGIHSYTVIATGNLGNKDAEGTDHAVIIVDRFSISLKHHEVEHGRMWGLLTDASAASTCMYMSIQW